MPAFEARHGVFICRAERVQDEYSTREVDQRGGKWKDELEDGTGSDVRDGVCVDNRGEGASGRCGDARG